MKFKLYMFFLPVLTLALLLSGCTGGAPASSWPGLTVDKETVYVAYNSFVYAINTKDGTPLSVSGTLPWRYPEKGDAKISFYAAPAVVSDQVIAGDYSNIMFGINTQNATERWKFDQAKGRFIGSPLVVNDTILAPNADHYLYALNIQGGFLWKFKTGQSNWSKPASDGKLVYLASMDHYVYAIDLAKKGTAVWKIDLKGAIMTDVLLSQDGMLYVATLDKQLFAISTAGKIQWQYATDNPVWGLPVLKDGILYFGDTGGMLYAVDAKTKAEKWKVAVEGAITGSPAVIEKGLVFVTDKGTVRLVGFDGTLSWNHPIEKSKLYGTPVVVGDRIIIGVTGIERWLVSLDFNGNEGWSFIPPK